LLKLSLTKRNKKRFDGRMCSYNKLYYQKRNQYLRISGSRVLGRLMSLNCGARKITIILHRAKLAKSRDKKKKTHHLKKKKK